MRNFSCILLAGGVGTRMKINVPKQFLAVGGKPMIVHILERIDTLEEIREVVIPSPKEYIKKTEQIISNFGFLTPIKVIEGGSTRQESVYKALNMINTEYVIIHEAVRPFVKRNEFVELIECEDEAAIYGIRIPFTVLEGGTFINKVYERDKLINVQLPQKFPTEKLIVAHKNANRKNLFYTEDASLYYEYYKCNIRILEGNENNIKITNPIDRKLAELIYKEYILGGE